MKAIQRKQPEVVDCYESVESGLSSNLEMMKMVTGYSTDQSQITKSQD